MDHSTSDPVEVLQTVEQFGVRIGRLMNWPPMAGRVLATLMLHEGPMTTTALRSTLSASAGAISESLRLLIESGVIRRSKTPGIRRAGYVYRDDAWLGCLQHELAVNRELLELAELATSSPEITAPHIMSRFEDMRDYYVFITKAFTELEAEFKQLTEKKTRTKESRQG